MVAALLLLWQAQAYNPRQDMLYRAYLWFTVLGVIGAFAGLYVISRQTKLAGKAADAALLSAQAVINAERAWITVDIKVGATGYKNVSDDFQHGRRNYPCFSQLCL